MPDVKKHEKFDDACLSASATAATGYATRAK